MAQQSRLGQGKGKPQKRAIKHWQKGEHPWHAKGTILRKENEDAKNTSCIADNSDSTDADEVKGGERSCDDI